MLTTLWNRRRLSRLMLGTVQLGMPYGVANRTGQPEFPEVLSILSAAIDGGVNCFDTAAAYGASEAVLGKALRQLGVLDDVFVVTKVRALPPEVQADASAAAGLIRQSVEESRQHLQLDCLPLVLFHRETDAMFRDVLAELQTCGWLHSWGVSCDNRPGNAARFLSEGAAALQIPASILDHRHSDSGVFQKAQAEGVAVFIRSVYLQGLLAMSEDAIPDSLRDVIPVRRLLERIAADAAMSLLELALRYMLSQPGVTSILTGVETADQMCDNLRMAANGPLSAEILAAIEMAVPPISETILTPALWRRQT